MEQQRQAGDLASTFKTGSGPLGSMDGQASVLRASKKGNSFCLPGLELRALWVLFDSLAVVEMLLFSTASALLASRGRLATIFLSYFKVSPRPIMASTYLFVNMKL
jgi:hypothetical protein